LVAPLAAKFPVPMARNSNQAWRNFRFCDDKRLFFIYASETTSRLIIFFDINEELIKVMQ